MSADELSRARLTDYRHERTGNLLRERAHGGGSEPSSALASELIEAESRLSKLRAARRARNWRRQVDRRQDRRTRARIQARPADVCTALSSAALGALGQPPGAIAREQMTARRRGTRARRRTSAKSEQRPVSAKTVRSEDRRYRVLRLLRAVLNYSASVF
jgi:hypothetical protein